MRSLLGGRGGAWESNTFFFMALHVENDQTDFSLRQRLFEAIPRSVPNKTIHLSLQK